MKSRTEPALRSSLRRIARDRFQEQTLTLSPETIGLACLVTGINDPAAALEGLVEEALIKWARLKMLSYINESLDETEGNITKMTSGATVSPDQTSIMATAADDDHELESDVEEDISKGSAG